MEYIITPHTTSYGFKSLWDNRELFYFLVWRDIKVRYKQTVIGIVWVVLQPFITMIVFSFLFGTIAKVETGTIPYPIFVYTGLLFWNLFSRSITASAESLVANRNLVAKVYFPRLILPIAATIANLVDFFFSFLVLFLLMIYFHFLPQLMGFVLIPFALITILILAIGIGSVVASLNVKYRDIRFILPYTMQIALFLTPVVYPTSLAEGKYRFIFDINPMSTIIEAIRGSLLEANTTSYSSIAIAIFLSIIIFFFGIGYFNRAEKHFADIV